MQKITICLGSSCYTRGNNDTIKSIQVFLAENNLESAVNFKGELCSCNCKAGPNIKVGDQAFHNIDATAAIAIIKDNLQITSN